MAQLRVEANSAIVENGKIKISFFVPFSTNNCYDIQALEVIAIETNTKTIPHTLIGKITQLSTGTNNIIWDYKVDDFFVDGDFKIIVSLKLCPLIEVLTPPKKEVVVNPPKKEKVIATSTRAEELSFKPHPIGLKIAVGVIGVATAVMANSIKSNFNSKLAILKSLDTSVNNEFLSKSDLDKWTAAAVDAQAARQTGLLNALVIGSALSFGYEVFLLATKVKVKEKGLSFQPSSHQTGISLTYKF
ncbi:hypothetical protein [Flectobacillus rivi]|uniref:DUF5683 domain-containing protein n=1 Tax=Flectobacillus rivi TaxID=2984209 RepID=A0ABT6Z0Z7_9BACT|nr:hypothetical protein [Flectobacillus rivi]MDI9874800.1 hypothetical protein [Flectobacillus rivi]